MESFRAIDALTLWNTLREGKAGVGPGGCPLMAGLSSRQATYLLGLAGTTASHFRLWDSVPQKAHLMLLA